MSGSHEDVNQGPAVVGVAWGTTGLATIAVALRLYVRLVLTWTPWWDDLCIFIAVALSIFGSVFNTLQADAGFGRHFEYIPKAQRPAVLRWTTVVELQNFLGLFFVRISICLFLLRLLSQSKPKIRMALFTVMAINIAAIIIIIVPYATQCIPFAGIWDESLHAKCFSKHKLTIVTRMYGGFGIVTDFLTATLPILILRGLNMDTRTKLSLLAVLSLGYLTAACSIGKTVTATLDTEDPSWDLVPITYWALCEDNFGIVVASLPALRKLVTEAKHRSQPKSSENNLTYTQRMKHPSVHPVSGPRAESRTDLVGGEVNVHRTMDIEIELSDRSHSMPEAESLDRTNHAHTAWAEGAP